MKLITVDYLCDGLVEVIKIRFMVIVDTIRQVVNHLYIIALKVSFTDCLTQVFMIELMSVPSTPSGHQKTISTWIIR